jgi:hypothetical protein
MVNAARLAYRPVGLLAGIAAGAVSGVIFKQVWKRVARQDDAPDALRRRRGDRPGGDLRGREGPRRPARRPGVPAPDG